MTAIQIACIVLDMNTLHVTYSGRYQNYVIVDSGGRQMFRDGRPLVYTTRDAAEQALRMLSQPMTPRRSARGRARLPKANEMLSE